MSLGRHQPPQGVGEWPPLSFLHLKVKLQANLPLAIIIIIIVIIIIASTRLTCHCYKMTSLLPVCKEKTPASYLLGCTHNWCLGFFHFVLSIGRACTSRLLLLHAVWCCFLRATSEEQLTCSTRLIVALLRKNATNATQSPIIKQKNIHTIIAQCYYVLHVIYITSFGAIL
ncbi:hypothetical protein BX070DRAFT_55454 [Coemansia spiralis]|nr:hypothetical protein BX070DRAFT_55454 [Coemansia spiralis]